MKKHLLSGLLLAAVALLGAPWELKNGPSGYTTEPDVINLVPGETQGLIFYLVAPDDVIAANKKLRNMEVAFTAPPRMEIVCSSGENETITKNGNETTVRFQLHKIYLHNHGKFSEWKTWRVAAHVPEAIATENQKLTMKLSYEGKHVAERTWKLRLMPPLTPAPALKYFQIGFFDNGYSSLKKAHPALTAFWKRAGLNCAFIRVLENVPAQDFMAFGGLHFSYFANPKFPTFNAKGEKVHHFVDGYYLKTRALKDILPNVTKNMAENATKTADHWTGMDYEVDAFSGFIPESIADFKKEYAISDDAFASMRALMVEAGHDFWDKATPDQQKTFLAWDEYQSKLHVRFITELKALLTSAVPDGRLYNTGNDSLPPPDPRGVHLGEDASLQTLALDMVAPQVYCGYDEKAAKFAIVRTGQWKKRIRELNSTCLLHPYFLVRYGGADLRNSPAKLRQQTIGAAAEGADGVSYYYLQDFDGYDWQELATTVRLLAAVEDFYHFGTRCEDQISVADASMQRTAEYVTWPASKNAVVNPDWHLTAHKHNGQILVTVLNLNAEQTLAMTLHAPGSIVSIKNGTMDATTQKLTVAPDDIAFILFDTAK